MYSIGIFTFTITTLVIFSILLAKRRKDREHGSNPGFGTTIFLALFGLVFAGVGLYTEMQGGMDPLVFGYDFSQLFGDLTPLVKLAFNPFFMVGALIMIGGANSMIIAMQLNNQGALTIPYGIRVKRETDSDGDVSYKVKYYYLDDYRGVASFTEHQFRNLQSRMQFLVSGVAQPQDIGRVFLVQYLEHDPTYHRLWESKRVPKSVLDDNKSALSCELRAERKPAKSMAPTEENPYGEFNPREYGMNEPHTTQENLYGTASADRYAEPDILPPIESERDYREEPGMTPAEQEARKQKRQNLLLLGLVGISVVLCLGLTIFVAIQQGWLAF